jgi:ribosomal protein S18 acetylase RimI-like enzyme
MIQLIQAKRAPDFQAARILFEEYAKALPLEDLEFQNFGGELTNIEAMYAPPHGRLLLARSVDSLAGCAAVRLLDGTVCEMKRLYVRPRHRGDGLGRRLAVGIIAEARVLGYTHMRLETLPSMAIPRALYRSLGFEVIEPYYDSPIKDMVFMELDLKPDE